MQKNMQTDLTELTFLFPRVAKPQDRMAPVGRSHDVGDFARIFERQKVQYHRDDVHKVKAKDARTSRPAPKPQAEAQNIHADADEKVRQARNRDGSPEDTSAMASGASAKREPLPDNMAQASTEAQNPADAGQAQLAAGQAGGQGRVASTNSPADSGQGAANGITGQPVIAQQAGVASLADLPGGVVSQVSGEIALTGQATNGQGSGDLTVLDKKARAGENLSSLSGGATGLSQAPNGEGEAQAAGNLPSVGNLSGEGKGNTKGAVSNAMNLSVAAETQVESMSTLPGGKAVGGNPGVGTDGDLTLRIRYAREHLDGREDSSQPGSLLAISGMQKGQQSSTSGQGLPGSLLSSGQSADAFTQETGAGSSTQGNPEFMTHLLQAGATESQDASRAGFEAVKGAHGARPSTETVLPQIVQKAQVILRDGSSEMRMQLVPEHLGKLEMKIVVHDGMVTARFMVENAQVKSMIEGNLSQLKQSLESMGFHIDNFAVGVGAGQQEAFGSPWSGSGRSSSAGGGLRNGRLRRAMDYDDAAPVAPVAGVTGVLRSNPYHLVDARM